MDHIRRQILKHLQCIPAVPALVAAAPLAALTPGAHAAPVPAKKLRMPTFFIGHGSPMNAIQESRYTQTLQVLGMRLPKPRAILVVSAHWLTESTTAVLSAESPRTIHDFTGFPDELYQLRYPAPGSPTYAEKTQSLLGSIATLRSDWGLDHGTWTVLRYMFPNADIPVFQVSIDIYKPGEYHYLVGKVLSELRNEDVLIVGSGNIVHNLRRVDYRAQDGFGASQPWAQAFDEAVASALAQKDVDSLLNYHRLEGASNAVPTPDHYWPLLYAMGAAHDDGPPKTVFSGFQRGTISMRCLRFG